MSCHYEFRPGSGLVRITVRPPIEQDDRSLCVRQLLDDVTVPTEAAVLIDVAGAPEDAALRDLPMMCMLLDMLADRFTGRICILNQAATGSIYWQMAVFGSRAKTNRIAVTSAEAEALTWVRK